MSPISALLALTLVRGHAGGPSQQGFGTMTLANRVVKVDFPTAPVPQLPDEVKGWEGFKYAPAGSRDWPDAFYGPGDWSSIGQNVSNLPSGKTPAVWREKVVILTQADALTHEGLYRQDRTKLDADQVSATLGALARFANWVKAETRGEMTLSLDVSVDGEALYLEDGAVNANIAADYLKARFNGGKFEADDKVFRGPYNSVVLIHPAKGSFSGAIVNGTPCSAISYLDTWVGGTDPASTGLEPALMKTLVEDLNRKRAEFGLSAETPLTIIGDLPDLASTDDLSVERLSALYKSTKPDMQPFEDPMTGYRRGPFSPNVTLSVVTDPERGKVLKYSEVAPVRLGGFVLPNTGQIDRDKNPYLKFWVKSSSRDDLALWSPSADGQVSVRTPMAGFVPDGKWHQVTVYIKGLNSSPVKWIAIAPQYPGREKTDIGPVEYQFSDFELATEGTTDIKAYVAPEIERASNAKSLTAEALAKDQSDLVRLNGLLGHEGAYDAKDETALIGLAHDANMQIAAAAIGQLAKLGTPTAKTEIARLVSSSPFERTKQVAALEVGKMGDPKLAGVLSRLFGSKVTATRLAGAQAIAMLPGDEAAVVLMTFLQEIDPAVRLAATSGANAQNSVVLKRLLWSAVNDPSDAVRATSGLRLIFSGNAKAAAEGYKSIRDDSVGVRLTILSGLIQKPDEAHRGAVRIAVVDLSPRVRAAALRAFATFGEVNLDEIANTLEDKYPAVQSALIDLAKAKHLALPKNAVDNLKASIDPHVAEKAKDLGS